MVDQNLSPRLALDARIPVLDRMHTKRLPVYRTLGFDVQRPKQETAEMSPPVADTPMAGC